jgi:hypothetical protein
MNWGRPQLPTRFFRRERLIRLLDENQARWVWIVLGQSGSGKTLMIADYLNAQPAAEVWIDLSPALNDTPYEFLQNLISELQRQGPGRLNLGTELLMKMTVTSAFDVDQQAAIVEDITRRLAMELTQLDVPMWIAVENVHAISSRSAHVKVLIELIAMTHRVIRWVVTGWPDAGPFTATLSEHVGDEEILLLGEPQLKLTLDERLGIARKLGVADLTQQTVSASDFPHAYLLDLLTRESTSIGHEPLDHWRALLKRELPDVQTTILKTAFLEEITQDYLGVIEDQTIAGEFFDRLRASNLLYWYGSLKDGRLRWHDSTRSVLCKLAIETLGADAVLQIRLRFAAYLEGKLEIDESIRQFVLCESWKDATRLIARYALDYVANEETARVRGWFRRIPSNVFDASGTLFVVLGAVDVFVNSRDIRVEIDQIEAILNSPNVDVVTLAIARLALGFEAARRAEHRDAEEHYLSLEKLMSSHEQLAFLKPHLEYCYFMYLLDTDKANDAPARLDAALSAVPSQLGAWRQKLLIQQYYAPQNVGDYVHCRKYLAQIEDRVLQKYRGSYVHAFLKYHQARVELLCGYADACESHLVDAEQLLADAMNIERKPLLVQYVILARAALFKLRGEYKQAVAARERVGYTDRNVWGNVFTLVRSDESERELEKSLAKAKKDADERTAAGSCAEDPTGLYGVYLLKARKLADAEYYLHQSFTYSTRHSWLRHQIASANFYLSYCAFETRRWHDGDAYLRDAFRYLEEQQCYDLYWWQPDIVARTLWHGLSRGICLEHTVALIRHRLSANARLAFADLLESTSPEVRQAARRVIREQSDIPMSNARLLLPYQRSLQEAYPYFLRWIESGWLTVRGLELLLDKVLTPRQATAFFLYIDPESDGRHTAIAEKMGVSRDTVRMHLDATRAVLTQLGLHVEGDPRQRVIACRKWAEAQGFICSDIAK